MPESQVCFFCCEKHNEAYIEARRRSRARGESWTIEEVEALNIIEAHRRELIVIASGQ